MLCISHLSASHPHPLTRILGCRTSRFPHLLSLSCIASSLPHPRTLPLVPTVIASLTGTRTVPVSVTCVSPTLSLCSSSCHEYQGPHHTVESPSFLHLYFPGHDCNALLSLALFLSLSLISTVPLTHSHLSSHLWSNCTYATLAPLVFIPLLRFFSCLAAPHPKGENERSKMCTTTASCR